MSLQDTPYQSRFQLGGQVLPKYVSGLVFWPHMAMYLFVQVITLEIMESEKKRLNAWKALGFVPLVLSLAGRTGPGIPLKAGRLVATDIPVSNQSTGSFHPGP